ncbi:MAG TPA: TRAP transporter small permease [Accumulibacter sp.]|uniref:TRAP transporter small permease n=1 Tax=Accumulibacter sp. TaxID=2053492 RepID=UPI002BF57DFD|nr:TRAP transporter small permease [Accumulibacter sp.]HRF72261.1 TRAP transporter small permease [Accumulibacter sp.]
MRTLLNLIYRGSGAVAALFMVGVLLMVITGVVTRELGIYVRGTDDYAGYCMAAAGFLALAYTFKHGQHIRVTLLAERLSGTPKKVLEWFALAFGTLVSGALAWYSVRLVLNSRQFNDISQGVDATPLWIPQLAMAAGTVILLLALIDDLVLISLGRPPARLLKAGGEAARIE